MSSIKLESNASGTGIFTIASPNSSTNRTLTLPDATGTIDRLNRAGNVLQVLSTTKLDAFTTTSGTATDVTGLSVSITPTSATSTVLVLASIYCGSNVGSAVFFNLVRDSTSLSVSTAGSSYNSTVSQFLNNTELLTTIPLAFLDSPNTTSAAVYKIQMFTLSGLTGSVNRRVSDAVVGGSSSITVMEIAA